MRVRCEVQETELENDSGRMITGVIATCTRCGQETESFGTSERSIRRCFVLMREDCGNDEENYYVTDGEEEYDEKDVAW